MNLKTAGALLFAATTFVCIVAPLPEANSQQMRGRGERTPMQSPRQSTSTLVVGGQGEAAAEPDQATVRLGAEVQADTAQNAQSQLNAVMQEALQKIRAVGIEERKIQTTGLQLFPVYERQKPGQELPPRVTAYRANNTVQVEIDDLALVGRVIDAGVTAGANRVDSLVFNLRDDQTARAEALQKAVIQARDKAAVLAAAAGVGLGDLTEIQEGGVNIIPPPRPYGNVTMMRAESVATPTQPGEVRVQASVTLRYELTERRTRTRRVPSPPSPRRR